jgi:hypothetical protein
MFSRVSRRRFFKLTTFLIAGTTAIGSIPLLSHFVENQVQAQEASEEVYKNRKIRVVPTNQTNQRASSDGRFDAPVQLFIDDQEVMITRETKTQKYLTSLLFPTFNSPQEIAKALIDNGIKFPLTPVKLDPEIGEQF